MGSRVRTLAVVLTEHAHHQTNQRTMGLWLLESLPALILVLSFITILLRVRTFETFEA